MLTVMRSVFEGGVGWIKGGMHDRSNESGRVRLFDDVVDAGDAGGE